MALLSVPEKLKKKKKDNAGDVQFVYVDAAVRNFKYYSN